LNDFQVTSYASYKNW